MILNKELEEYKGNVIILLMGSLGSVGVCRSLMSQGLKVIGISKRVYLLKTKMSYRIEIVSNSELKDLLNSLKSILKKKAVFLTDSDEYVDYLLENYESLKEDFIIPYNGSIEITKNLMDKNKLPFILKNINVCTPETVYINNLNDLRNTMDHIKFPVIVKPLRAVKEINKKAVLCNNLKECKQVTSEFLQYNASVVIQEYIDGDVEDQFCITTYVTNDNRVILGNMTKKVRLYPVDFGMSSCQNAIYEDELLKLTEKVLLKSGYKGVSEIEFKRSSKDKKLYLIEVNCRFPIEAHLNNVINKNFIHEVYLDLINKSVSFNSDYIKNFMNLKRSIFWISAPTDVRSCFNVHKFFLIEYLKLGLKCKVCWAAFSLPDILFSISYSKSMFSKVISKKVSRRQE